LVRREAVQAKQRSNALFTTQPPPIESRSSDDDSMTESGTLEEESQQEHLPANPYAGGGPGLDGSISPCL
jgi:hypothetical protein